MKYFFVVIFLCCCFLLKAENSEKALNSVFYRVSHWKKDHFPRWSGKFDSILSRPLHYTAKTSVHHKVQLSYGLFKLPSDQALCSASCIQMSGEFKYPVYPNFLMDSSPISFGLGDFSLSFFMPFQKNLRFAGGAVLPASKRSRRKDQIVSFFSGLDYKVDKDHVSFLASHVLSKNFYLYFTAGESIKWALSNTFGLRIKKYGVSLSPSVTVNMAYSYNFYQNFHFRIGGSYKIRRMPATVFASYSWLKDKRLIAVKISHNQLGITAPGFQAGFSISV